MNNIYNVRVFTKLLVYKLKKNNKFSQNHVTPKSVRIIYIFLPIWIVLMKQNNEHPLKVEQSLTRNVIPNNPTYQI